MRVSSSSWSDMKRGYISMDCVSYTKISIRYSLEDAKIVPLSVVSQLARIAPVDGYSLHVVGLKCHLQC